MSSIAHPLYSWAKVLYKPDVQLLKLPNVRESFFYRKSGDYVICKLCHRSCKLKTNAVGACGVRFELNGKLYTTTYGLLSAVESRPMEIKPMYHFYPGTSALTISTWGCNFPCAWCQNWHLSKFARSSGRFVEPTTLVKWAVENGDSGVNISFNEPTLLAEYAVDLFKIAESHGLHTSLNTNGYLTEEALEVIKPQGLNIDIKGGRWTYKRWLAADFDKYISTARRAVQLGAHVEFTYLVIPGVNDNDFEEIIDVVSSFGRETPLHITAYHPAHLLNNPPTPLDLLHEFWERAKRELDYVYVGNVDHPSRHTYCPKCGEIVIKRVGDRVVKFNLNGVKCPRCGHEIYMRGKPGRYGNLYKSF